MKKIIRKAAWAVLTIVFISVFAVPQYLYLSGLQNVPDGREPVSGPAIPGTVAVSFWHYLGGEGEPAISAKNPYGLIAGFLIESFDVGSGPLSSAEYVLLSQATRSLMFREEFSGDWHLSNASALIWISRNWTVDEAISTVLLDSYFGNGFRGIDSAAVGYLGTPLSDVTDIQMVYLLVIRDAPSRYDPWCNPENHRTRFRIFSERLGLTTDYARVRTVPAPEGKCD